MGRTLIAFTAAASIALASLACGQNVFRSREKSDPATDAALDLERDNPSGAIDLLTAALQSDPSNAQYLSILASAYAQRAGVEPLTLGSHMAESQSSSSSSTTSNITSLFSIMPAATATALADIDAATFIMANRIAPAARQAGDTYKLAIFQTAAMVMHLKVFDTTGSGTLSASALASMSDATAITLLAQLASSQAILAANGSDKVSTNAAASLAKYQTQINAAPGTSVADKLRNYLANNSTKTSTATSTSTDTSSSTDSSTSTTTSTSTSS